MYSMRRPMYWSGDCLSQQRWKHQLILVQITMKIWLRYKQTSKSARRWSTLRKSWSWNMHSRFWMFPRLNGPFYPWMRFNLLHDQAIKWAKSKVHVYSDSVLCLGKCRWKDQLQDFQQSHSYRELFGIDGEPVEFEWNISEDSHLWRFFNK